MKPSLIPGLNGYITNSLALNRELARAVGFVEVARYRSGAEPPSAAKLVEALQFVIDYIEDGSLAPVEPTDPTDPTDPAP